MAWGFILGLVLGALLMYRAVEEERKANERLKKTISNLEEELKNTNFKIVDLENNLKLVTNSLSEENKKLIPDFDSQN